MNAKDVVLLQHYHSFNILNIVHVLHFFSLISKNLELTFHILLSILVIHSAQLISIITAVKPRLLCSTDAKIHIKAVHAAPQHMHKELGVPLSKEFNYSKHTTPPA